MTPLRFPTGERHQNTLASLRGPSMRLCGQKHCTDTTEATEVCPAKKVHVQPCPQSHNLMHMEPQSSAIHQNWIRQNNLFLFVFQVGTVVVHILWTSFTPAKIHNQFPSPFLKKPKRRRQFCSVYVTSPFHSTIQVKPLWNCLHTYCTCIHRQTWLCAHGKQHQWTIQICVNST